MSTGGIMLLVSLASIIASVASTYLAAKSSMGFGHDVRGAFYKAVGSFSDREFNSFGAPTLITRNTNDVLQIQALVMLTSSMLVSAPLMCIGGIIMALRENLQMSWLLTISVPLLGITVSVVVAKLIPHFRTMQTRIDNINRSLREQLTGMRVIRAFVREPDETIRFDKANKELTDTSLLIGRYQAVLLPTVMLIANLSSVAVLWFGAHLVDTGDMQIGPDQRLPRLRHADPDVRGHGDHVGRRDPPRRRVRRPHHRSTRHRGDRARAGPAPSPDQPLRRCRVRWSRIHVSGS